MRKKCKAAVAVLAGALLLGCGTRSVFPESGSVEIRGAAGLTTVKNTTGGTAEGVDGKADAAKTDAISEPGNGGNQPEAAEGNASGAGWKRMVMRDGKLYVETGETNSMLRCGMMDGKITSTTDGETPTEDGQSNFGADIGYQYGTRANRIEIFLDDQWRVFAYNENNLEGVTMSVSDVTADGCTVVFQNDSKEELTFGEDYILERLDAETLEWRPVYIVLEGEYGFDLIGYPVAAGESRDWEVNWNWLYGSLEPGTYRIVKNVSQSGAAGYTGYTMSQEFEVVSN